MPSEFLTPGRFVDSDSPRVRQFARDAVGAETDPIRRAIRLFDTIRDQIWYDPFAASNDPASYRASVVAQGDPTWCIPKAVLLAATARAVGIPARLGFADVRNHLQTPKLRSRMGGSDLFAFHGYTDLYLDGRWVKATPAFNAELCARFGVAPIAFDGRHDALLHEHTPGGGTYMEYVKDRGVYADLPLSEILGTLHELYGPGLFSGAGGSDSAGTDGAGDPALRADGDDPAVPGGPDRTGDLFAAPTS